MSKYKYRVKGRDYDVEIENVVNDVAIVHVNGKSFEVELVEHIPNSTNKPKIKLTAPKPTAHIQQPEKNIEQNIPVGAGRKVIAPLPGTVTDILVKVGDNVKAGDNVIVLEAMKMQNNIEADNSGKVTSILVNKGDTVMEGTTLITIE